MTALCRSSAGVVEVCQEKPSIFLSLGLECIFRGGKCVLTCGCQKKEENTFTQVFATKKLTDNDLVYKQVYAIWQLSVSQGCRGWWRHLVNFARDAGSFSRPKSPRPPIPRPESELRIKGGGEEEEGMADSNVTSLDSLVTLWNYLSSGETFPGSHKENQYGTVIFLYSPPAQVAWCSRYSGTLWYEIVRNLLLLMFRRGWVPAYRAVFDLPLPSLSKSDRPGVDFIPELLEY